MSDFELTPFEEKPEIKNPVKSYAAAPGSGRPNEKCGTCAHAYKAGGGARYYWKCDLVKRTGGPGTDIRLKSPACFKWEPLGTVVSCRNCHGKGQLCFRGGFGDKMTLEFRSCTVCGGSGKWADKATEEKIEP